MSDPSQELDRLHRNVRPALMSWLTQRDEASLRRAYELGREALGCSIGLLDVVRIHDEVHLEVMATIGSLDEAYAVAAGAAQFLIEMLAPYEMARRGFLDLADIAPASPRAATPSADPDGAV